MSCRKAKMTFIVYVVIVLVAVSSCSAGDDTKQDTNNSRTKACIRQWEKCKAECFRDALFKNWIVCTSDCENAMWSCRQDILNGQS
ncbi:hypothetical protein LSAT2_010941 [Lamellibrachia satsuma]|nr:hypothetical protein LSAT2_010941 [Lamellibrachia satsuma]